LYRLKLSAFINNKSKDLVHFHSNLEALLVLLSF